MGPDDYLDAVELAFRALGEGRAHAPPPLGMELAKGGFHAKAAVLSHNKHSYVALKFNGNFPNNPSERGLPTVQGLILLCDGESGVLLAILDSIEVTLRRTAAATALAAKYLARPSSETILICGCGEQAPAQLAALRRVLSLRQGFCWDGDHARARALARKYRSRSMTAVEDLAAAAMQSDVIVTCTTATKPFLDASMVKPGTFIAAVGADNPRKSEIEPVLMGRALVVTDSTAQSVAMGDLHHAIKAGILTAKDVHAELAELVVGSKPGRADEDQITLFDSTGVAIQDVASAVRIYNRALSAGALTRLVLSA
jgi:ornithine cyclodeaminase/alanine dehydrogenase-like protein (mu-crystallin family)